MALLHSLRAFWLLLLPASPAASVLYVLSSAAILSVTVRLWRTAAPLECRYSALVLATVLAAPHLEAYDLVLVPPAFVLTAAAAEASPGTDRCSLVGGVVVGGQKSPGDTRRQAAGLSLSSCQGYSAGRPRR